MSCETSLVTPASIMLPHAGIYNGNITGLVMLSPLQQGTKRNFPLTPLYIFTPNVCKSVWGQVHGGTKLLSCNEPQSCNSTIKQSSKTTEERAPNFPEMQSLNSARVTPKANSVKISILKFNSNSHYIFNQKEPQASTICECEVK